MSRTERTDGRPGRRETGRGISPVVGIVLLVGLVSIGSVGLLLVGGAINEDSEREVETARIERGFLELGSDVTAVSRTSEYSRVVDLALPDTGGSAVREERTGRIWINSTDLSGGGGTTELVNRSIGAIRYESEDGTVFAYQSGAVFKGTGAGAVVLSNPGFEYALNESGGEPTLSVPIVTTVGPDTLPGGKMVVRKNATRTPINNKTVLRGKLVTVTVKSEWYVGWADYFRTLAAKTGTAETAVTVDPARQTATLRLVAPESRSSLNGIVSGSPTGNLTLSNTVGIASYNSSRCAFNGGCGATEDDGDLYVAGNLTLENKAQVRGSVYVGKTLRTRSSNKQSCPGSTPDSVICEDANYGTWVNENSAPSKNKSELVGGSDNPGGTGSLPDYSSIGNVIATTVDTAKVDNRNGPEADVDASTNSLKTSCPSADDPGCELDSGTYYLDELVLTGDLVLNTTDGPITLAVDGRFELSGTSAELTVVGDNRASVFVDSDLSGDCDTSGSSNPGCDFYVNKGDVLVKNASGTTTDRASNLWVYMKPGADAAWQDASGSPEFTGVLFGPGNASSSGVQVDIGQQNYVQGTIVGNITTVGNSAELRYDRSLRRQTVIVRGSKVPKITYLVASEFVVEVDDE